MNRRTFFNGLGAAIIGTTIALKIPNSISGIEEIFRKPRITFVALLDAYNDATNKGGVNPFKIVLHPEDFDDAFEEAKRYMRFGINRNDRYFSEKFMFMNAEIESSDKGLHGSLVRTFGFGEVEQGTIETVGETYGSCGKYRFI